jgi:hypothetical protein
MEHLQLRVSDDCALFPAFHRWSCQRSASVRCGCLLVIVHSLWATTVAGLVAEVNGGPDVVWPLAPDVLVTLRPFRRSPRTCPPTRREASHDTALNGIDLPSARRWPVRPILGRMTIA